MGKRTCLACAPARVYPGAAARWGAQACRPLPTAQGPGHLRTPPNSELTLAALALPCRAYKLGSKRWSYNQVHILPRRCPGGNSQPVGAPSRRLSAVSELGRPTLCPAGRACCALRPAPQLCSLQSAAAAHALSCSAMLCPLQVEVLVCEAGEGGRVLSIEQATSMSTDSFQGEVKVGVVLPSFVGGITTFLGWLTEVHVSVGVLVHGSKQAAKPTCLLECAGAGCV